MPLVRWLSQQRETPRQGGAGSSKPVEVDPRSQAMAAGIEAIPGCGMLSGGELLVDELPHHTLARRGRGSRSAPRLGRGA